MTQQADHAPGEGASEQASDSPPVPVNPASVIPASVILVSRGRPQALRRCLRALSQLTHPLFEIVVVADPASLLLLRQELADRVKSAACDEANISVARNIGLRLAAGEVVAFIDDDAVPEPTWLSWLAAPFERPEVAAAGGFVLGRNGLSWQWQARDARPDARCHPLQVDPSAVTLLTGRPGRAIKTEGTNMAFRRAVLAAVGGFDPAFRFYLDETDLNLRLAETGLATAVVPMAVVHHGFAPSARRDAERVPLDLHEIGASLAVFLRKHRHPDPEARFAEEATEQRQRLVGHMVAGRIDPRDVGRLLQGLREGWEDGQLREIRRPLAIHDPEVPFLQHRPLVPLRGHRVLSARGWQARGARRLAVSLAAEGYVVSLYVLRWSAGYHRVRYHPAGFWLQSGGLFGKSLRSDPPLRLWSFARRLAREVGRTEGLRWPWPDGRPIPPGPVVND